MHIREYTPGRYIRAFRSITIFSLVLWTTALAASLFWNVYQQNQMLLDIARVTGRAFLQKDVLYRRWASAHGGVYVPVTDQTQPNPYLDDYEQQNITTGEGKIYTLINPAYMTRQVFDLQDDSFEVIGHITSLNPIRPGNAADDWEKKALLAFERGENEVSAIQAFHGQTYLRLMRPLKVEPACLTCHAKQGYEIGQIRGGISESVLMEPLVSASLPQRNMIILGHIALWAVGFGGILLFSRILRRSLDRQQESEEKLLHMSTHDSLTGLFNRSYFSDAIKHIEDIKAKPVTFINADLDHLKIVNDTMGHEAGDFLIKGAAEVLKASFRAEDVVARVGGDEFVVIMAGSEVDIIDLVIDRIRDNERRWNEKYPGYNLSLSIGTASTSITTTMQEAMKAADERMYADKSARKAQRRAKAA